MGSCLGYQVSRRRVGWSTALLGEDFFSLKLILLSGTPDAGLVPQAEPRWCDEGPSLLTLQKG